MTGGRVLVVTNDFPPRPGGIQSFVHGLVSRLPADDVVVLTSRWRGWQDWDREQPYEVVRADTSVLLPTPAVRRQAVELFGSRGCTSVWFGAAAPLGLLAPALRRAGAQRIVATTHGHEVGWSMLPAARRLLRRIGASVDVVTYLGEFTRGHLAGALGRYADRLARLAPGVDATVFRPGRGVAVRASLGLDGRPVVVCVSRLMPRKGQDVLLRALPMIRESVPDAALLLVGGGPSRGDLERYVDRAGLRELVVLTGSVPAAELPSYYGAGDVFAMPCRSRLGGLDVEGLGMVYLEAAACGLPVVAGRSGGAPDAVRDGETGVVVDGRSVGEVAAAVTSLLADRERAGAIGARGRDWVEREWSWDRSVELLRGWF
ncbi:MAG: phosphatidyl-myo-inositol dimannoside synthase [Frankiaceae bacterium]|nr:phosphatidyl-myo-inositol dimannoside synthase [Frankiaceae bacterium]